VRPSKAKQSVEAVCPLRGGRPTFYPATSAAAAASADTDKNSCISCGPAPFRNRSLKECRCKPRWWPHGPLPQETQEEDFLCLNGLQVLAMLSACSWPVTAIRSSAQLSISAMAKRVRCPGFAPVPAPGRRRRRRSLCGTESHECVALARRRDHTGFHLFEVFLLVREAMTYAHAEFAGVFPHS
jgi:hypothetical protein